MELNDTLTQIDLLKQEAEKLQPVKPEFEKVFWDKFRLEFNYNSNHMEGNTLTYGHTLLLLLFDRISGDFTGREIEEMKAHDVALKMVKEMSGDPETDLTEKLIREINELILVRPFYNKAITPDGKATRRLITPGTYKKYPNSVLLQDGELFQYASPEETPSLMGDLIEWYNQEKYKTHPVRLSALFHYKLVRIHPFDDSNGRTTRLVMNYILMKSGYAPLVIESKKKEMYLAALNKADVGDVDAFADYITGIASKWQEIYLKAIKGEKVEEPDDFEKEVELLKKKKTKENKIAQKISTEVLSVLFANTLKDIFIKAITKLNLLDSLFYSRAIQFGINKGFRVIHKSSQIEKVFEENKKNITDRGTIDFKYIHKALPTKNNRVIDIYSEITIKLDDYTYSVNVNQNKPIISDRRYGEFLNETEIDNIVAVVTNTILQRIKENN